MMEYTDRHDRYFLRLLTRRALLYSEMITTAALLNGDAERLLAYDAAERPLALQLGGSDPAALAACSALAERAGYDEVNLNVGCPSARVREGRFGACLMKEPEVVAECVGAMREAVRIPVTVKMRIGVDELDAYDRLVDFIDAVRAAGCRSFIIHARKAWLHGLSPKQNREVPPLRYDVVYRLKAQFPALELIVNGGIASLDEALAHLERVDGVMIGREAYHNPYLLAAADRRLFGDPHPTPTRRGVLEGLLPYVERERQAGTPLAAITRHLLGLFHGCPGAKRWRRHLSEHARAPGAGVEVIEHAFASRVSEPEDRLEFDAASASGRVAA